jgi:sec-independent protein translocase protein TatA
MPFNIGAPELIIILIIALIVIGPGRLPDVGSALGKSIREFRKASSDVQESTRIDTGSTTPAAKPPSASPSQPPSEASTEPRS